MILGGIDSVGPDDVGAQFFQVWNITLAASRIGEWVDILVVFASTVGRVILWRMSVLSIVWGRQSHTLIGNTSNKAAMVSSVGYHHLQDHLQLSAVVGIEEFGAL